MKIVEQLQIVENAIIELTKPPLTAQLLNKLSPAMEQAEAQADAIERQAKTLATQFETIERLMKEKKEAETKLAEFQRQHLSDEAQRRAWNEEVRRADSIYENMYQTPE